MNDHAIQAITETAADTWQPANLSEAMRLADTISKSGLVPEALRGKSADTLLVMMKGRELGLSVMQAMGGIDVIKGKTQLSAALMRGLVTARKDVCKYLQIVEMSNKVCRMKTLRVGHEEPIEVAFTMEDAKAAGLLTNANYSKYPADMLLARCTSRICKAVYADLVAGLYVEGELPRDDAPVQSTTAQAIQNRLDPAREVQPAAAEVEEQDAVAEEVVEDDDRAKAVKELRKLCTTRAKQLGEAPKAFAEALLAGFGADSIDDISRENLREAITALKEGVESHGQGEVTP